MFTEEKRQKSREANARWRSRNREKECMRHRKNYANDPQKGRARTARWRSENYEQDKLTTKAWREANKERYIAMKKTYRKANTEKIKAYRKANYEANRERDLAAQAEYKRMRKEELAAKASRRIKENPGMNRYWRSMRRAAEKRALPQWANRRAMKDMYLLAAFATREAGKPYHVDHIVPLKSPIVCDLHWEGNLQILPGADNQSKSNRHWPDMP